MIKLVKEFLLPKIKVFFFSIILLIILCLPALGATTYDFTGITNPSSSHIAYGYEIDVTADPTSNTIPATEISTSEYQGIETSDTSYAVFPNPGVGNDCAIRCKIEVNETPANVGMIYAEWQGKQGSTYPVRFLIWNYNSSAYELLQEANVGTTDVTLSSTKVSNCANYIDGSGYITLLAYEANSSQPARSTMSINCVKVIISLRSDLTLNATDIGFSNDDPPPGGEITISATIHNNGDDYFHLYQNWDDNAGALATDSYAINTDEFLAQSFTPSYNIKLGRISLYISAAGTCGTLTVKIVNDDGTGKPSNNGADILSTAPTLDSGPGTKTWIDFEFSVPPDLSNGTTYWLVAEGTGADNSNCWGWQCDRDTGTNFPGGNIAANTGSGTTWITFSATDDFWFRAYTGTFVLFYDGDPDSSGIFISTACINTPISGSGTDIVNSTWTYPGGSHDIYIKIDPDNLITESNETNNKAYKNIECETTPPNALTDLAGQTGTEEGEIDLSWTAPGDDGTGGNNTADAYYTVRYATFSCQVAGSTETWWNHVNVSTHTQTWTVAAQGNSETNTVDGLTPGTTYYFAIKTTDKCLNISAIDENADQTITQAQASAADTPAIPPAAITDIEANTGNDFGSINLSWTAPGDDGAGGGNCVGYELRYSSTAQITSANYNSAAIYTGASSWTPVNFGTTENRIIYGLDSNTAYWVAIKAYDNSSNYGSWSSVPYSGDENKATTKTGTLYYVHSNAPNDSGVPNSNPALLDNCWKTIGQAFSDLCTNESNDLTGKYPFFIQIQNSADYVEGVELLNLTTTSNDTLTIRAASGERPTWRNDTSTVLFSAEDPPRLSYGALKVSIPYVTVEGINFTGTEAHGVAALASFITIRNCIFHDLTNCDESNFNHNSTGIWRLSTSCQAYNNTFYNVITGIIFPDYAGNLVRNNIFCVNDCSTEIEQAFLTVNGFDNSAPDSDYNTFYVAAGNRLAYAWGFGEPEETYTTLADWQACYLSPDANSISGDPKFVTPGSDFHLKSTAGHWTSSGWVNDAESSPCIDNGEPYNVSLEYSFYQNETAFNGSRVNMGAYANTDQASRSGTGTNISISIDSSAYDFGTVLKNSTNVAVSSITVTNDGNVAERYSLHLASPAGWTATTDTAPGAEEFRFCGNFQTATAQSDHFVIAVSSSDAVGTSQAVCSNADFAKDDEGEAAKGYNVPSGQDRYLWFRFESPTSTALTTQQTITVTITAEQQP